jgi:hypothetical protein
LSEIILWSGLISGLTFAWLKWWGGLRIDEATEDMGMDAKSHSPPKAGAAGAVARFFQRPRFTGGKCEWKYWEID